MNFADLIHNFNFSFLDGSAHTVLIMCTILFVVILLIGRRRYRSWRNPLTIFISVWTVAFWTSTLDFLNYYAILGSTYALIALSIVAFSLGYLLIPSKKSRIETPMTVGRLILESRWLPRIHPIVMLILFLILLRLASSGVATILAGGGTASSIRGEYSEYGYQGILKSAGGILGSRYGLFILWYLIWPGVYWAWIISVLKTLKARSAWDGVILFLSLLLLLLLDIQTFSRMQLTFASLFLILVFMFGGHLWSPMNRSLPAIQSKILRRWSVVIILISVIAITTISAARAVGGKEDLTWAVAKYPLRYFSEPICLFERRDVVMVQDGFLYTVGGLCDLSNDLWHWIFRQPQDLFVRTMNAQSNLEIGSGVISNANFTWCLAFYQDAGAVGLIIFPFVFGIFVAKAYDRYRRSGEPGAFIIFLQMLIIAVLGILDWRLMWGEYLLPLLPGFLMGVPLKRRTAERWIYSKQHDMPSKSGDFSRPVSRAPFDVREQYPA